MIKRIIKVAIWAICYPLIFVAVLSMPITAMYSLIRYIVTGSGNEDVIFLPMDWAIDLPYNIIDKWEQRIQK